MLLYEALVLFIITNLTQVVNNNEISILLQPSIIKEKFKVNIIVFFNRTIL